MIPPAKLRNAHGMGRLTAGHAMKVVLIHLGSTTQLKRPDALQTEVGTMGCEASVRQVAIKAI